MARTVETSSWEIFQHFHKICQKPSKYLCSGFIACYDSSMAKLRYTNFMKYFPWTIHRIAHVFKSHRTSHIAVIQLIGLSGLLVS